MYVCIMRQCFGVGTSYGCWLGLTTLAWGGMSQLVSEPCEYNMTLTAIFLKTYGEDMLQCPYKDYSSLDRWQANRDLLSIFIFCNLLFCNDAPTSR
jgi:hypothetical protein